MRWRVYLLLVFLGLSAIPASLAHADGGTLQDQYLKAYQDFNIAQYQQKSGDMAGALNTYKNAYAKLYKIHHDAPEWETALVVNRMRDCKAMIDDLTIRVGQQPQTPPIAPPVVTPVVTNTNTVPVNPPSIPQLTPLPPVTGEMSNDIPTLKKQLADVEAQLRLTQDNLRASQTQVDAYQARLESVNLQLQALTSKASADDKVGRLVTENKELTDKLSAAEKQLDDFKKNPKSRLAQVETQLKNVQEQLDATQSANTTLQKSFTDLQQRFDQSQAELVAANQKLASISPTSPDYATVKRENELLRGMMQRELQEQARRDEARRLYLEEFNALKIKSSKLQEQFDNMTTPPFPPTTDEERTLMDSLKVTGTAINNPPASGNSFSAPAAGTENGTNAASATSPDVTNPVLTGSSAGAMADESLDPNNAPAVKSAEPPPAPPAPTPTPTPPAPTPTPSVASTPAPDVTPSAPPVTPPANPPADTNSGTTAPVPPDGVTTTNPPPVPPAPSVPPTPPSTPSQTIALNNTPPSSPADNQPSNPPTVTHVPPGTTQVTETQVTPGSANNSQPDPTEWTTKARLPEDMRDTAQAASDFFNMKKYDEAAAKYQVIIDKYPECLYAWSNLGVVRFQQGDLNDALKALQQAVKISPTDSFSYSNLGIVYYNLNQYENAIDALNAAKQLDPKDAKIHNYLGCACSQKGWQEVAEKEFRAAIDLDPNFADAHFNLALVYATEKPPAIEMARTEYNKALELGIQKDDRLEKLLGPSASNTQ